MKNLINLLSETLLLEKKIGQISSNINIVFNFDVINTNHSYGRKTRDNIKDYNEKIISNDELLYFINLFKRDIAENIAYNKIEHDVPFVIKSVEKELACVIDPECEYESYWKLVVVTVFRESSTNKLRVGPDQLVLEK
jgi:hypothetical protein